MANSQSANSEWEEVAGSACSVCGEIPESIIFLLCDHAICIVCVARSLLEGQGPSDPDFSEAGCPLCGVKTALSEDVQETLLEFLNSPQAQAQLEEREVRASVNANSEDQRLLLYRKSSVSVNSENEDRVRVAEVKTSINMSSHDNRLLAGKSSFAEKRVEAEAKRLEGEPKRPFDGEAKKSFEGETKRPFEVEPKRPFEGESKKPLESERKKMGEPARCQSPSFRNKSGTRGSKVEESTVLGRSEVSEGAEGFEIPCPVHLGEKSIFYNSETRRLLCVTCLMGVPFAARKHSLRPLNKCYPEVLQDIEETLTEVETQRKLLQNRKAELRVRREAAEAQSACWTRKVYRLFDALIEIAEEQKRACGAALQQKLVETQRELRAEDSALEETLQFFDSVLDSVGQLKHRGSQTPEQDFFNFFASNQQLITSTLERERNEEVRRRADLSPTLGFSELLGTFAEEFKEKTEALLTAFSAPRNQTQKPTLTPKTPGLKSLKLSETHGVFKPPPLKKVERSKPFLSSSLLTSGQDRQKSPGIDLHPRDTPFKRLSYNFMSRKDVENKLKAFEFRPNFEFGSSENAFYRKNMPKSRLASSCSRGVAEDAGSVLASLDFARLGTGLGLAKPF